MVKRLRTDKDYIEAGVEPPEHIVHEGSEQVLTDTHLHSWKAIGNFLHCEGSETATAHGVPYDHINKVLVGTDADGAPVFKDIVVKQFIVVDSRTRK